MQRSQRSRRVEDQLQRLCQHDRVEAFVRNLRRIREVRNDRRCRVVTADMQHVTAGHALPAEAARVGVLADFQDLAPDRVSLRCEEAFDVEAIHGQAAVHAEFPADRRRPPQVAEVHRADGRQAEHAAAGGLDTRTKRTQQ